MGAAADDKARARRTWGDSPTGTTSAQGAAPGTREFFERAYRWRSEVEQPWLVEVAPFHEWAGRSVLEVGFGPGYDTYSIVRAGAKYSGVDITPENVARTKAHLALYGLSADVREGDAEHLPFADEMFEIVYSNGVLHHTPDMDAAFREACRALKSGGRFHVIVYHRDSIFYRVTLALFNRYVAGEWRHRSLDDQLRRIEYNGIGEMPLVALHSRAELRERLERAGFRAEAIKVRKLVPEDLPHVRATLWLNRLIPHALLDLIGRRWGWYVCGVGVKA